MNFPKVQTDYKNMTQKDRIGEELKAIKKDVTEANRKEYIEKFGGNAVKLSRYLNGNVGNADEAVNMLSFFRKKILAREKILNKNS